MRWHAGGAAVGNHLALLPVFDDRSMRKPAGMSHAQPSSHLPARARPVTTTGVDSGQNADGTSRLTSAIVHSAPVQSSDTAACTLPVIDDRSMRQPPKTGVPVSQQDADVPTHTAKIRMSSSMLQSLGAHARPSDGQLDLKRIPRDLAVAAQAADPRKPALIKRQNFSVDRRPVLAHGQMPVATLPVGAQRKAAISNAAPGVISLSSDSGESCTSDSSSSMESSSRGSTSDSSSDDKDEDDQVSRRLYTCAQTASQLQLQLQQSASARSNTQPLRSTGLQQQTTSPAARGRRGGKFAKNNRQKKFIRSLNGNAGQSSTGRLAGGRPGGALKGGIEKPTIACKYFHPTVQQERKISCWSATAATSSFMCHLLQNV